MESNIYDILTNIQSELNAPKGQRNKFGNYDYRSCEDILKAVKPLLKKYKCCVTISDKIVCMGDNHPCVIAQTEEKTKVKEEEVILHKSVIGGGARFYVEAIATLHYREEKIEITASARESKAKKGMDESQITGASSSYARKYALNGLFAIDDTKDADSN